MSRFVGFARSFGLTAVAICLLIPPVSAAEWDAGGGERWDALMAAAREEGGLVAAGCQDISGDIARAFKRDTGLETLFITGQAADISNRFQLEVETGRLTMDIRLGGGSDAKFAAEGKLVAVRDLLVLPGVTDPGNWADGHILWFDKTERFIPIAQEYVSSRPVINTNVIDRDSVRNLTDLLKPEFKGKIASYDPIGPGAGESAAAYFGDVMGVDFLKALFVDQEPVFSRDHRQLGEWAARGVHPIILGMDMLYLARFHDDGIDWLEVVTPEDAPGSLLGSCSALTVPKGGPNPNATAVFINWYLSQVGQHTIVEAGRLPTRRTDVAMDNVPAYFMPQPGLSYIRQYAEDWYFTVRPRMREAVQQILNR